MARPGTFTEDVVVPLIIVHLVAICANIMHMIMLSRMEVLKSAREYRIALYNITINDIIASVLSSLDGVQSILSRYLDPLLVNALVGMVRSPVFMKYLSLLIMVVQRYLAICKPMSYSSHPFIKRIHLVTVFFWMFSLILSCATSMLSDLYCDTDIILYTVITGSACTIITTLLALIWREMRKMESRSSSEQVIQIREAVKYLLALSLTFIACLTPLFLSYILKFSGYDASVFFVISIFTQALYSIMNIITYGLFTKAYRKELMSLFRQTNH